MRTERDIREHIALYTKRKERWLARRNHAWNAYNDARNQVEKYELELSDLIEELGNLPDLGKEEMIPEN